MKKTMYKITEWSSDNAYTGWFSLDEILSNSDISNGSINEDDWHCEIHEVKEIDVNETLSDKIISLSFSEEQELINAIEKMMQKRHNDWVKIFMIGRKVEDVGSIPSMSITHSEKFIKEMLDELKIKNYEK